jgi:hypothetical protein
LEIAVFPAFGQTIFAKTLFDTRQGVLRPAGQVDGDEDPVKSLTPTLTPVFCSIATQTPISSRFGCEPQWRLAWKLALQSGFATIFDN